MIEGGVTFASTDESGYADLDVHQGAKLIVTTKDQRICQVDTSVYQPIDGLAYQEEILCQPLKR